jgi:hypothetical protein
MCAPRSRALNRLAINKKINFATKKPLRPEQNTEMERVQMGHFVTKEPLAAPNSTEKSDNFIFSSSNPTQVLLARAVTTKLFPLQSIYLKV